MEIDAKTLGNMMGGLVDAFNKEFEEDKKYDEIRNYLKKESFDNVEAYNVLVIYPINQAMNQLLKEEYKDNHYSATEIFLDYSFYSSSIEYLIVKKEGSACSCDKSRWLLGKYLTFLKIGELPDLTIDEKCYWKPAFWGGQEWMDFIASLHRLKNGSPEDYLKCLLSFGKM